ncbi:class E sortase [Streptomyces sp. ADI96-02]|uniref:class E sortase n=1 Tax=Streptomyces sp. ADI96-02 TaxID=1522760 RepID=UPI001F149E39|nr:class E sortase [Streptomyces sp. ADI96-02]
MTARPGRPPRSAPARLFGVLGEVFVTVAVIMALFLVYRIWWTNVEADRMAQSTAKAIRAEWSREGGGGRQKSASSPGIGFLHVPALGGAGEIAIVEGTDPERLDEGVAGFYTHPVRSAMPWDREGNFSLAAHRDGHGAKFHNLDKVRSGDHAIVETEGKWYVYTIFATLPKTADTNVGVIDSIPKGSGRYTRGQYITLTTCTPVFTSDYRLIVWGELTRVEPVTPGRTPPPEMRR